MKDSGIEWLGEIPAHWGVRRLRQLIAEPFKNGIFKKKEHWGRGTAVINVGDLYSGNEIDPNSLDRLDCSEAEQRKYAASQGDFFFVRSSLKLEGIGKSASLLKDSEPSVFECHIVRGRPMIDLIEPKFLSFLLNSTYARAWFVAAANTVTMATIDQSKVKDLMIGLPPYTEQEQVAESICRDLAAVDGTASRIDLVIEKLREYRSALITNAVTGQIKVA
jgi:type I restriction enzyme S subunit